MIGLSETIHEEVIEELIALDCSNLPIHKELYFRILATVIFASSLMYRTTKILGLI